MIFYFLCETLCSLCLCANFFQINKSTIEKKIVSLRIQKGTPIVFKKRKGMTTFLVILGLVFLAIAAGVSKGFGKILLWVAILIITCFVIPTLILTIIVLFVLLLVYAATEKYTYELRKNLSKTKKCVSLQIVTICNII